MNLKKLVPFSDQFPYIPFSKNKVVSRFGLALVSFFIVLCVVFFNVSFKNPILNNSVFQGLNFGNSNGNSSKTSLISWSFSFTRIPSINSTSVQNPTDKFVELGRNFTNDVKSGSFDGQKLNNFTNDVKNGSSDLGVFNGDVKNGILDSNSAKKSNFDESHVSNFTNDVKNGSFDGQKLNNFTTNVKNGSSDLGFFDGDVKNGILDSNSAKKSNFDESHVSNFTNDVKNGSFDEQKLNNFTNNVNNGSSDLGFFNGDVKNGILDSNSAKKSSFDESHVSNFTNDVKNGSFDEQKLNNFTNNVKNGSFDLGVFDGDVKNGIFDSNSANKSNFDESRVSNFTTDVKNGSFDLGFFDGDVKNGILDSNSAKNSNFDESHVSNFTNDVKNGSFDLGFFDGDVKNGIFDSNSAKNSKNSSFDESHSSNVTNDVKNGSFDLGFFNGDVKNGILDSNPAKNSNFDESHPSNFTSDLKNRSFDATTQNLDLDLQNKGDDGILNLRNHSSSYKDCDIFNGRWVKDDTKPYYRGGSCPHIDRDFDCHLNKRPDDEYVKWKWQPFGCEIPSLNATDFLERLRGKKLVFVGDSLNRNMWESLVCILRESITNKKRVYEISGRHEFKKKGFYAFRFEDYNCTIDFVSSPFLVRESIFNGKNGSIETLRLDLMDKSTSMYHDADVLIFNTGHWWTHEKTSRGEDYYQEGEHVYPRLKVLDAYKRALSTWARWVDKNIDINKTQVIFRGYSVTHFKGGQWNSGGQCHKETEPIFNSSHLTKYPTKMRAFDHVLKEMKTPIIYLNISRLTDYRKDGHPSIYRMKYKSVQEQIEAERSQDCSHWCLPGVPDTWNELLYASLLKIGRGSWKI